MDTAQKENKLFIHPFNDTDIINGQSTVCYEIYKETSPDFIISPVGGGGLISGIINYSKAINPDCKIIGVDISESMRNMAIEYVNSKNFKVLSPENLKSEMKKGLKVDAAYSIWVLQHCLNPSAEINLIKTNMSNSNLDIQFCLD